MRIGYIRWIGEVAKRDWGKEMGKGVGIFTLQESA
jgi:hypothetical protein